MRTSLYILGTLHDTDVAWISRHGRKYIALQGTRLIQEGEPVDSIFIVLDGQLSVRTEAGGEVARFMAGDIVGEISFVDSKPPLASVIVVRDSLILSIPRDILRTKIDKDAYFAGRFYRALAIFLADRLRTTTRRNAGLGEIAEEMDIDTMDSAGLGARRFQELIRNAPVG